MNKYKGRILLLILLIIFGLSTTVNAVVISWSEFASSHLCIAHGEPFRVATGTTSDGSGPERYAKKKGSYQIRTYKWVTDYDNPILDKEGNPTGGYHSKKEWYNKDKTINGGDLEVSGIKVTNYFNSAGSGQIKVRIWFI